MHRTAGTVSLPGNTKEAANGIKPAAQQEEKLSWLRPDPGVAAGHVR